MKIEGSWYEQPGINIENEVISGTYRFVEFHLHWAEDDYNGTEHPVFGKGSVQFLKLKNRFEKLKQASIFLNKNKKKQN